MRALMLQAPGKDGLELVEDARPPTVDAGSVLIRTVATSVNPVDIKTRNGTVSGGGPALPNILGWDLAGVVVDPGGTEYAVGDRVIAMSLQLAAGLGTWADLVAVPASAVAHAPRTVSLAEAATLPLPGLTAWQCVEALTLAPGARLLVAGAVGAVGGLAVQLAGHRGVKVDAVVAKPHQVALASALGAHEVFLDPAEAQEGRYDAVFDTVGIDAGHALRDGTRYLTCATEGSAPTGLDARGIELVRSQVRESGADLTALVDLVDGGNLRLRMAQALPLQEYRRALDAFEAGGLDGAKLTILF